MWVGWCQTVKDLECQSKDLRLDAAAMGNLMDCFEKKSVAVIGTEAEEWRTR